MKLAQQSPKSRTVRTRYLRRTVGVAVCFGPVALAVASLSVGVANGDFGAWGVGLAVGGFLFAVVNADLAFVRPWRYRRRHGSLDGFRFVSGLPVIGTLCAVAANVVGFGEVLTGALGLATLALDAWGLPWFLVCTWRDRSFWDAEPGAAADPRRQSGSARVRGPPGRRGRLSFAFGGAGRLRLTAAS